MKYSITIGLIILCLSCQTGVTNTTDTDNSAFQAFFPTIDTIQVFSDAMDRSFPATIVLPRQYQADSNLVFPVVYLLHGYSGSHQDWLKNVPTLGDLASEYNIIIVLPDGAYNSWYLDSPLKEEHRFATFVGRELPAVIDQNYRTKKAAKYRGITGLSMGGHGALYLTTQYPDQFGAVASMSGGLDLRPFSDSWEIKDLLGSIEEYPQYWSQYSVINNLENLRAKEIPILIDCGIEDFFFETNQAAHQQLLKLDIPHDYFVRPGGHSWDYWINALPYHLLFFKRCFD